MEKEGFVFYRSFLETAEQLNEIDMKISHEYLMALLNYGIYGIIPEDLNPIVGAMLNPLFRSIDAANERYERAKENGKKGGRPRKVDWSEMYRLMREGKTDKEIAETLNCTADYVRKKRKEKDTYNQKNQNYLTDTETDTITKTQTDADAVDDTIFLPAAEKSQSQVSSINDPYNF